MKPLMIGERVRVKSTAPSCLDDVGRIVQIVEPFVAPQLKDRALMELPLYSVRLEDGRNLKIRGRDLVRMTN
jgi:hypothetical protein